jgi:hypothetical protein
MSLSRVMEYSSCAEVDKLYDIIGAHYTIVEFQIAVRYANFMEIFYAIANLAKDAVNFRTAHFARHDDGEEVVRSKFHDLEVNV